MSVTYTECMSQANVMRFLTDGAWQMNAISGKMYKLEGGVWIEVMPMKQKRKSKKGGPKC
jgi:hypothetical protein